MQKIAFDHEGMFGFISQGLSLNEEIAYLNFADNEENAEIYEILSQSAYKMKNLQYLLMGSLNIRTFFNENSFTDNILNCRRLKCLDLSNCKLPADSIQKVSFVVS
jgi:hypothetical protein